MPFTYSSKFWRQRAHEANSLAVKMRASDARAALLKTAWTYELIYLRTAHHEAKLAFERAKASLLSGDLFLSAEDKDQRVAKVQEKRAVLEVAGHALEHHRKTTTGFDVRAVA